MENKAKKILAGVGLGLVGMSCLTGCSQNNDLNYTYNLTVINDSLYGIINPTLNNETNSITVDKGDNYTFTITPKEGYEITNLLIDGKLIEPQSIYTFENIDKDHSIGAIYSQIDTSGVDIASIRLTFNHGYEYLKESDFEWTQTHNSYSIYTYPENTKIELTGTIIQLLPDDNFEYNYLYEEKEIANFAFNSPDNFFESGTSYSKSKRTNLILGNLKNKVHFLGSKQEARFKIVIDLKFSTTRYEDEESIGTYSKTFNMVASIDQTSDNKVTLIEEDGYEDLFIKSINNGYTFLQKIELVFNN